jgi:2-dehydro-3-deoxyphosphogluconate aldolase / (4S)-4-hydroxy-2-oxoglutarate aldolase
MKQNFSWDLFNKMPIIGIMRNLPVESIITIADIYCECGFSCLEITMNSAGAAEIISVLSDRFAGRLNIGAGTVCEPEDLKIALQAGASFIVTPVINKEVIEECVRQKIAIFPGADTPTEIYQANKLGADVVKVFPANIKGPGYIKEVLGPLNWIQLLPTGGIGYDNFMAYFTAGARGVGIGSKLFPPELIQNRDWLSLENLFKQYVQRYLEGIS